MGEAALDEALGETMPAIRHYFVDEAGDPTLFNRTRQVAVGMEGCSRYFILGLLDVEDPDTLSADMERVRKEIFSDPYFRNVPSLRPEARKTASAFHAKDDLPEVRHKVYQVLVHHDMRFFAVVRDKRAVVAYVRQRNERERGYRYHPNELYDFMVRRLFRDHLHKHDEYRIVFARRGRSDRTAALRKAIQDARRNFEKKHGIVARAPVTILAATPHECAGLQAVDYFLWAVQRLYERGEDRYVGYLWNRVSLVHDIDDTREAPYGRYYTRERPLTSGAVENRSGI